MCGGRYRLGAVLSCYGTHGRATTVRRESHTRAIFAGQFEQLKKVQLLRRAWACFFRLGLGLQPNRTEQTNRTDSRLANKQAYQTSVLPRH